MTIQPPLPSTKFDILMPPPPLFPIFTAVLIKGEHLKYVWNVCVLTSHSWDLYTTETTDNEWFPIGQGTNYFWLKHSVISQVNSSFSFLIVYSIEYRFERFWNKLWSQCANFIYWNFSDRKNCDQRLCFFSLCIQNVLKIISKRDLKSAWLNPLITSFSLHVNPRISNSFTEKAKLYFGRNSKS